MGHFVRRRGPRSTAAKGRPARAGPPRTLWRPAPQGSGRAVAHRKKPEPGPRPAPWNKPFVLGIDENGMGPRLGPLIVTAVLVETDEPGRALATSRPRGAIAKRIGD